MPTTEVVGASFRDPSGFVFRRDGIVYRQVNQQYAPILKRVEDCGLYEELVTRGLLVAHEDVQIAPPVPERAARVILPEQIEFISYPYEWCFGQLRDAALATLDVQLAALQHRLTLKDASAFNIQFRSGRPILIDSLSFEPYEEGQPWVAYRQFCEHFLAPLLLIKHVDPGLGRWPKLTVDGIPLEVASRLLPRRTWLQPSALLHIHLHARSVRHYGARRVPAQVESRGLSARGMRNLIEGLRQTVLGLDWTPAGTEWAEYQVEHGYSDAAMKAKGDVVGAMLGRSRSSTVWDLGANTGEFSRIALASGARVISIDADPAAVERNYRRMRQRGELLLHPLWIDLRNPTPGLGWAGLERESLAERSSADVVLALALVHHLAIGGNVPLPRVIEWFAELADNLIVEFVPKDDPQVRRLLVSRVDIFDDYSTSSFESALSRQFDICESERLPDSGRVIYRATLRD